MTGYSETPLQKKLGIKCNFKVAIINEPDGFRAELGVLPQSVSVTETSGKTQDLILFFADSKQHLGRSFPKLAARLVPNGMLWVSWPKKSSGVQTDLDFDVVQKTGLSNGLVDTKSCAVDETWSGLKFVIRLKDRPAKM